MSWDAILDRDRHGDAWEQLGHCWRTGGASGVVDHLVASLQAVSPQPDESRLFASARACLLGACQRLSERVDRAALIAALENALLWAIFQARGGPQPWHRTARQLWTALRRSSGLEPSRRWFPEPGCSDPDGTAVAYRALVHDGCSQTVYFPVVALDRGDRPRDDLGAIVAARVVVVNDKEAGAHLEFAPWSRVLLARPEQAEVLSLLRACAPDWLSNKRVLLDLEVVPQSLAPTGGRPLFVDGDSFGLAVLLAAWASAHHALLYPNLVASAGLRRDDSGRRIVLDRVGELEVKRAAVERFAAAPPTAGQPVPFLVHPQDAYHWSLTAREARLFLLNELPSPVRDGEPWPRVEVGQFPQRELLGYICTEGFHDYRAAVVGRVEGPPPHADLLEQRLAQVPTCEARRVRLTGYAGGPGEGAAAVARYILRRLVMDLQGSEEDRPPVPLPLNLVHLDDDLPEATAVAEAVWATLGAWRLETTVPREVVTQTVLHYRSRVWLVLFHEAVAGRDAVAPGALGLLDRYALGSAARMFLSTYGLRHRHLPGLRADGYPDWIDPAK